MTDRARRVRPLERPPSAESVHVYPPREDTALLARAAPRCRGRTVLEVGAGSGAVAIAAARAGARTVVATDLNPHALRAVRRSAQAQHLKVELVRTDLAAGLGRFDRLLANPPYLPTRPEERDPDRWTNIALDGGLDGCRVLARLVHDLPDHLAPGGAAYVVGSSLQAGRALAAIVAEWKDRGGDQEVVADRWLEGERLFVWRFSLRDRTPVDAV